MYITQVFIDHEALEYFATKRLVSSRQANWADFLSRFDFTIHYRPGKENIVADALSRKHELLATQKAVREAARTLAIIPRERFAGLEPLLGGYNKAIVNTILITL